MPVSKYTVMKKRSHLTCLRNMMGQTCPIRAFASTYHTCHFIVSQYIFMLAGSKCFLGNTWKKLDILGRKSKGKNYTISNDIDSKRSSPHCFQDLNLHPWVKGFVHTFSNTFFPLKWIFLKFLQYIGDNLYTEIKQ